MKKELLNTLIRLAQDVIDSADNTGCTDDLTVVSQDAITALEDFLRDHVK